MNLQASGRHSAASVWADLGGQGFRAGFGRSPEPAAPQPIRLQCPARLAPAHDAAGWPGSERRGAA
jgi:hypothetical protein